MSAKVDQFCDSLRDRLNAIEARVGSVKENIEAFPEHAEKAFQSQLANARTKLKAEQQRIDLARAHLKAYAEQKAAETREAVSEWKANREVRKLNARADRAEEYAACALVVAAAGIDEAEEAILNAIVARMEADAAQ
jgi:hypothetical protein